VVDGQGFSRSGGRWANVVYPRIFDGIRSQQPQTVVAAGRARRVPRGTTLTKPLLLKRPVYIRLGGVSDAEIIPVICPGNGPVLPSSLIGCSQPVSVYDLVVV